MTKAALKEVAHIQVGYQAKARIKQVVQGTHRLIQSKDFDSSHCLRFENLTTFLPERKPEAYSLHKGDVLFQARGVSHFAYCIQDDLKDTLAAGSFYILRIKNEDLLPRYLAWWMNQSRAQAYLRSQASRSAMSFVSKGVLSRLQVQIPPVSVQEKIVKIVTLARREEVLLDRLAAARLRLARGICMKVI